MLGVVDVADAASFDLPTVSLSNFSEDALLKHKSVQIAFAAQLASLGLDADRSKLYFDLILASLSDAARRELQTMDPAKYQYQSDFAKRYVEEGRVQGEASGRAALVIRQLQLRFGPLEEAIHARLSQASIAELDAIGERLLSAGSADEALDSHWSRHPTM